MDWIAANAGNIVALLFVALVVGFALNSVIRGHALDCSSCSGDCGGCGGSCKNPKLKLSQEQLAQLDELDSKYGVSK